MSANHIGVIFDCDGTLLDSMGVWYDMQAELVRRAGGTITKADVEALAPMSIPECGAYMHEKYGLGASGEEVVGMIDDYMIEFYGERSVARPGALAFVEGLAAAGVRMTVASSSPRKYLVAGLTRCSFAQYMDEILSVEDVNSTKREPVVWDRAREIMGTPLATTWGVEDSAYAVDTLRNAGYRTIGVRDNDDAGSIEVLTAKADHAVMSFEDLTVEEFLAWNTALA